MRLQENSWAPDFNAVAAEGGSLTLWDFRGQRLLLKFHRFTGCSICLADVNEFVERRTEIRKAGFRVLAFLHSSVENVASHFDSRTPVHVLADPRLEAFDAYGVERSVIGFLHPRAMWSLIKATMAGYIPRPGQLEGHPHGMPADFLIDEEGIIKMVHYGRRADDSLSVDQALEAAARVFEPLDR